MLSVLRRVAALVIAVAAACGLIVNTATTAAEATTRVVYVDVAVASTWSAPIRDSLSWVDRYTGSDMVLGRCRTGYKCIIIREKELTGGNYGWTVYQRYPYYHAADRPVIWLDPSYRGRPDWLQRRLAAHELGHANGITWHAKYCNSIMWHYANCANGTYPPWRFTAPMLDRLRVN